MSGGLVLRVEDVGKRYSRDQLATQKRVGRVLFEALRGRAEEAPEKRPEEIDIVKAVSFEVRRGEALGIIGVNGTGKTTLLRMLAGHVLPDRGSISVYGTTGTMIDLTTGIRDSMTGRTNIYLRSAILGRRRREVDADIEEIIDYTELREAIDAPVSTYSSGMRMRLAFATTIFMRPDLLLVDEVLSVGDFRFRQKCLETIRLMRENAAFVLVSHSMGDISRFCDRVIVLESGRAGFSGSPDDAIAYYYDVQEKRAQKPAKSKRSKIGESIHNAEAIRDVVATWKGGRPGRTNEFVAGASMSLKLKFTMATPARKLIVGVPIYGRDGEFITALSSEQARFAINASPGAPVDIEIAVPELRLTPGHYHAVLAIVDGPEYLFRQPIDDIAVVSGGLPKYWGSFTLDQKWTSST